LFGFQFFVVTDRAGASPVAGTTLAQGAVRGIKRSQGNGLDFATQVGLEWTVVGACLLTVDGAPGQVDWDSPT